MMVPMKTPTTRLLDAMKVLRAVDPEMQLLYAAVFLEIASRHPKPYPMQDLEGLFGVSRATISRIHVYLSNYVIKASVNQRSGYGLIRSEQNPENRRCLDLFLTTKGKTVHEQVTACLERK
jgi:DNA-binding MarR family transcriptional regulator